VSSAKMAKILKEYLVINRALHRLLRSASPRANKRDISWSCVDLAGLWEVTTLHRQHIRSLIKCSYPRDREKIEELLTEIQVNLLSQGIDHIETLKKVYPVSEAPFSDTGMLRIIGNNALEKA
jgi:hypothetical protein